MPISVDRSYPQTDFFPLAVNKLYFAFIMIYFRHNVFLQLGTYHFYLQGPGGGVGLD